MPNADKPLPQPWALGQSDEAFWIEAANGARFAYTYFRATPLVGTGEKRTTRAAALAITRQIMKLPDLLG